MENSAFDVTVWLNAIGLTDEKARNQARKGFHAGYDWAADEYLGKPVQAREDAYSAGEGYYTNGFDQGVEVYQSGDYEGGIAN